MSLNLADVLLNVTTAQRDGILTPEPGAVVWNVTDDAAEVYSGALAAWVPLGSNPPVEGLDYVSLSSGSSNGTLPFSSLTADLSASVWTRKYDPANLIDTATDQIVVQKAGVYRIAMSGKLPHTGNQVRHYSIRVNNVEQARTTVQEATDSDLDVPLAAEAIVDLVAGDVITLYGPNGNDVRNPVFIVQQLPSATVIDPEDVPVNDQTASGYFDVGDMRVQFWRQAVNANLTQYTFPQPFGSGDLPRVFAQMMGTSTVPYIVRLTGVAATQFYGRAQRADVDNIYVSLTNVDFFAIGPKP